MPTYLREEARWWNLDTGGYTSTGAVDGVLPYWGAPAFEDTFSAGTVDLSKWVVRDHSTHGSLSYDWGYITTASATVTGGNLRLRCSRRGSPITASSRVRYWDTPYLDTIGRFSQTYGRWEARMKIPTVASTSQGVWPAFWLRNTDQGEIDIMESWGDTPRNRTRNINLTETSTATIHEATSGGGSSYGTTYEHRVAGGGGTSAYNTAQGFHTWAVEYTPAYLRFLFDGTMTADIRSGGDQHPMAGANATRDFSWVWGPTFTAPWAIRLNLQMGDPYWSSDTDPGTGVLSAATPADLLVDHVRCWAYPG